MNKENFNAKKTRSNRPGWSVTFRHPRRTDSRGKFGLKIRRGLGTQDDIEADRLMDQLNELLDDESWWSIEKRPEAEEQFAEIVVSIFFDGIEVGKYNSSELRDSHIKLPGKAEGYARVMLVGTTGAGKTTLLRHLIGSDHEKDRFPSTSAARTTIADIEIITADGPFEAVVTFMPKHKVRENIDECLEEACLSAVQGYADDKIAGALLSDKELKFRLSYLLGSWQNNKADKDVDEFSFDDEEERSGNVDEAEAISAEEYAENKSQLDAYIDRIKIISSEAEKSTSKIVGPLGEQKNPEDKADWLQIFADELYKKDEFSELSLQITEDVEHRFDFIKLGEYVRASEDWPKIWTYANDDRDVFLRQMRWFASNHHKQFGRLLTPLVDGMRVRGHFKPAADKLHIADKLVLLDGQGLGHNPNSSSSISPNVTSRFADVDMILLVDNAEQPMQAAPLELLRSVGNSGHSDKLAIAFTHFDMVKGDNLGSFTQKREHVMSQVSGTVASLRQPRSNAIANELERQIDGNAFFLGGLDRSTDKMPAGFLDQIRRLLESMKAVAQKPEVNIIAKPNYSREGLEIALRDAVEGFREPWKGRLGIEYKKETPKEHWTRIKALSRRFATGSAIEYDNLGPIADLIACLQENISSWLENPSGWEEEPESEDERIASLSLIRQSVFQSLHDLANRRINDQRIKEWQKAYYEHKGKGSTYVRAKEIDQIYEEAAPMISSVMSDTAREFLHELHQLIDDAVEDFDKEKG